MGKAVQAGLTSFWSGGRVLAVAARLVERYFPLTSKDIQVSDWNHMASSFRDKFMSQAFWSSTSSISSVWVWLIPAQILIYRIVYVRVG